MTSKRLAFLIPPGNPNTEGEIIDLKHLDYSLHFTRMVAHGVTGSLDGQEARNRAQIEHLDENIELLKLVKPSVIAMAHTASSYTLGTQGERELVDRLERKFAIPFITAFASVVAALKAIGVRRVALGTPYSLQTTLMSKALLEANGLEVVNFGHLPGVLNIYDETLARAKALAHQVHCAQADCIFLSGVGMPTLQVIESLESELKIPVISSIAATFWNALNVAGLKTKIPSYGSLLARRYG